MTTRISSNRARTRTAIPRRALAVLAVGVVSAAGMMVAGAAPASAASVSVTDATFAWGLSGEQGGGAFFGGCNFLSAGKAGNTGSSRLWTQADGLYSTHSGNVTVEKPNNSGDYTEPTWATKCQDPNGTPVSAGSTSSLTRNRVVFSKGTGTIDTTAHTASIHWTGSFTSVFYGGLTYWSATDPTLTVNPDGTGTLTATATGYGADMNDPGKWVPLPTTTITLATFNNIDLGPNGVTVTPDYLGQSVTVPSGTTGQPAKSPTNQAHWGSFPQDFVDFQQLTGQSSYWFTSGGARDAAKPATPLTLTYTTRPDGTATPTPSGAGTTPTASATPASPAGTDSASPTDGTTSTAEGCEVTDAVKGGNLTWGFKKSFRSYVGGPSGNSITADKGLKILAQDLAVAGKNTTGTYQWPFESSSAYTSPEDFTVQYGGRVTYAYPAHYFKIVIAEPRLVVHGTSGTLYADVSLTVNAPDTKPTTDARNDVALASLDLSGGTAETGASGITRTVHTAIQDTKAFTFNGSSFYQKGQQLDDATVLLSGCTGTGAAPTTGPDETTGGQDTGGAGDDSALVPDTRFRPDALASTGIGAHATGALAAAATGAGAALVLLARRRGRTTGVQR
ncbi:HtaA domain-containing protein [Streptomyces sp. NPDC026673]|uniref:HtaA domain-containing protein n=1 Tax=Streptomyces sp. NPDC026673 TaxID=3155724 RepID=UPI0033C888FE